MEIRREFGLPENDFLIRNVQVEITPPNNKYETPTDLWNFRVDQIQLPDWWDEEAAKLACYAALSEYLTKILVRDGDNKRFSQGLVIAIGGEVIANGRAEVIYAGGKSVVWLGDNASCSAGGHSTVITQDYATVFGYCQATINAHGRSRVTAHDQVNVNAQDQVNVNASDDSVVTATDKVAVHARGRSKVTLIGHAMCWASETAEIEAVNSAIVVATDQVLVKTLGNEAVAVIHANARCALARGKSTVVLRDNCARSVSPTGAAVVVGHRA